MFFLSPQAISFPLKFSIKSTSKIIFVCGKDINASDSRRSIFLKYAKRHLPDYKYLLAEDFVENIKDQRDFLTLESIMTHYASCIIIILESESAFTELGAFAHDDNMAKKILIINDKRFKDSKSFINLGPVAKVNKYSNFGSPVHTDFNAILFASEEIKNKLRKLDTLTSRIDFSKLSNFKEKHIERIHWLADFILMYSPISVKEIIGYLKNTISNDDNFNEINSDIAILKSIKYIESQKLNDTLFYYRTSSEKFTHIENDFFKKRLNIFFTYKKMHPERINLLTEIALCLKR